MKKALLLFMGIWGGTQLYSQTHPNVFEDWRTTAGTQHFFYKNVTKTNASGDVFVAGATMNGAGNYDILVAKYNSSGLLQWINQVDGTAHYQDFATALQLDNSGNVYITGAITNDTVNQLSDLILIKYNSGGTEQWRATYDGANLYDCGTDITASSGGVLVTGSSYNASANLDFVSIFYNTSGVHQWTSRYDHAGMNDVPVQIQKIGSSIYVSGGVQTGATTYDWAAVKYNTSGVQQSVKVDSGSTSGIEEVHAMVLDASGNIYLAGIAPTISNGYDYDIIKLDSNLVIQWENTYDGAAHLDDIANAIQVNASGDVYVTGSTKTGSHGKDYLTLKYNSAGSLIWTKTYNDSLNGDDEATAMVIGSDGKFYITGSAYKDAVHSVNYHTMKYDTAGTVLWSIDFDGSHHLKDQATNMALNAAGDVVVTGESETAPGVYEYSTVKYLENITAPTPASMGVTNDTDGNPVDERSTVIVRFNPDYLVMTNIDNRDFHCSHASTFIADTVLYMMGQKLFTGTPTERLMKMRNVTVKKIFPYMASADSISITRSGEHMHVPPFWATLEMFLPGMDEYNVCDSLETIFPEIFYAHPNFIFMPFSVPDDSLFGDQASLAPTATFANGNINVEPAWDIETGKKFVKVGVNDSGIDPMHPDIDVAMRVDGATAIFPLEPPIEGHGTAVAGIIGAKRNNHIGVAGIAGGDGSDSTGCSIYDMDIGTDAEGMNADLAAKAIIVGAANFNYGSPFSADVPESNGLALNVMNDSWGNRLNFDREAPPDPDTIPVTHIDCDLCIEAMEFAFRNGCITTAARGNYHYASGSLARPTDRIFPACVKNEFVLNVGSVGTDGKHKKSDNGGDGTDDYESMYGWGVDIVAPGNTGTVYTTHSQTIPPYTQLYSSFSGTSAAAPHVAGVVALMLSHVNTPCPSAKNLAPEDVEYIIKKTANPRITGVIYDDTTGYGLLDAGAALQAIQEPKYQIIHVNNTPVSISTVLFDTATLYLHCPYFYGSDGPLWSSLPIIPNGLYNVDIYKTTVVVNHDSNLSHFSSSATILDHWVRNSSSIGWGKYISADHSGFWAHDTIDVTSNIAFDSGSFNASTATLIAYTYYIKTTADGIDSINRWYPADTSHFKFSYSIYMYDPDATSVPTYPCDTTLSSVQEHKPINHALTINSIYPNPAADDITIEYSVPYNGQASVSIIDLLGRTVKTMGITSRINGSYKVFINISNLAKGTYFLQVKTDKESVQKKCLIIR
ncbi:MAG: hypothetical protein JWP12_1211 [Bacteroidetes bacterium]|nr:hypothetical protein [Bacteroidota bacterium]